MYAFNSGDGTLVNSVWRGGIPMILRLLFDYLKARLSEAVHGVGACGGGATAC